MLHELVDYGRRHGIEGETGFLPKTVRWLLTFDPEGKYLGLVPLGEGPRSKGRQFPKAPHLKFAGDTPMRQFLVDTAEYALMYGSAKDPAKLRVKHEYFLRLLREAAAAEPVLGRIAAALTNDVVRSAICADLERQSPKAKPADSVTFAEIRGDQTRILVEQDAWHDWWRGYFPGLFEKSPAKRGKPAKPGKATPMRCFITGQLAEPCRTHPKVKGLGDVGGNVETTLVGFNLDAFRSYGLEQSSNAAVSNQAAEDYAAALNDLIARQSKRVAGAKVVYWYVADTVPDPQDDILAELFGDADFGEAEVQADAEPEPVGGERPEAQATSRAGQLLEAIRTGQRSDLRNCQYRALTLSANAGRVVVRDWMQGQFQELAENVEAWFSDLAIVRRDGLGLKQANPGGPFAYGGA